jgi:hypothetical protein
VEIDREVGTVLKSFESRGFRSHYAENRERARAKILDLIPEGAAVGIGDSTTIRQVGIVDALKNRGTKVLDRFHRGISLAPQDRLARESMECDVFLTGTNAVTVDGRLVNVDGVGNRVAGMFYGPPTSIIVVGKNKLVNDLEEAFHRIRSLIAPTHIRIRGVELGGWRPETPCITTGECYDCRSKERVCNVFTIIEGKPLETDINVVVINEDLGLGWDKAWPKERILKIIEEYKRYVWIPPAKRTLS